MNAQMVCLKRFMNITHIYYLIMSPAVVLAGFLDLSQLRFFSNWKDPRKTLWRKNWSASKDLDWLKGMRDILL